MKKENILLYISFGLISLATIYFTYTWQPQFEVSRNTRTYRDTSFTKKFEFLKRVLEKEGLDAAWKHMESASTPAAGSFSYFMGEYLYDHDGFDGLKSCHPSFLPGCRGGFIKSAIATKGLVVCIPIEGNVLLKSTTFCLKNMLTNSVTSS